MLLAGRGCDDLAVVTARIHAGGKPLAKARYAPLVLASQTCLPHSPHLRLLDPQRLGPAAACSSPDPLAMSLTIITMTSILIAAILKFAATALASIVTVCCLGGLCQGDVAAWPAPCQPANRQREQGEGRVSACLPLMG